jgi:periplasmic protein TonB
MTSNEILRADLLDIIFDGRNKKYGAYDLRRSYNSRMYISLFLSLGSMIVLLLWVGKGETKISSGKPLYKDSFFLKPSILPPIEKIPELKLPSPVTSSAVAEGSYSRIKLVEDPKEERELLPVSDLETMAIGINNIPGDEISFNDRVPIPGTGEGKTDSVIHREAEHDIATVDELPEFPGGMKAWINYLRRNLVAPASLEAGESKTVIINFKVDTDGSITSFYVKQSAGREFDNEVMRVIKKMPKWKPAIKNGKPVAVPFFQPVTFVGTEQ